MRTYVAPLIALVAAVRAGPSLFGAPAGLLVESLPAVYAQGIDVTAPRFSWSLSAATPGTRGLSQAAYELQLSLSGDAAAPPLWTSGRVASNETSLVAPPGAPALPPSSKLFWAVRVWDGAGNDPSAWSALQAAYFTTGLAAWDGEWVCGVRLTENVFRAPFQLPPAESGVTVALALAHVAGLGVHAVRVNGAPAGGDTGAQRKLDGGWTRYARRVLYTTHDLTAALLPGENVLAVSLGNGWFNSAGWYQRPPYGWPSATNGGGFSYAAPPLLRVQLVLRLSNGTMLRLATAGTGAAWPWAAAAGPVTFDSLYDGEAFDGLRAAALAGWDAPGFAPAPGDWLPVASASNASVNPAAGAALSAQPHEPVVRLSAAPPLASWEPAPGVTAYDCGANGVGAVQWTFRGLPAGTNVTMRYAEVLRHPPYGPADGSLYFDNLRNAHATDYYVADSSGGVEVFEPAFSWHGFRYAQVSGALPAAPALADVLCVRQANDAAPGASAAFAAPLLGRLLAMAATSIGGNLQGGPGSCGQRDERQFFTGDTQVTAQAAMQTFRLRPLLASWVRTGMDEQNADGAIGFYLPTPNGDTRDGSPQWSTGFLTVAWLLGQLEGDWATLAAAYPAVRTYAAFNEGRYNASVAQCGGLRCYWPAWPSEWQQVGAAPDASCMNAFAYVRDLQMAADVAGWLGLADDAAAFAARAAARVAEFHAAFYNASAVAYGAGTQSEAAVALWLGAPPTPAVADAVFAGLLASIAAAGGKQSTGIVGTRYLYEVLAAHGRADVGAGILLDDTFPSFGFMAQGAANPEPSATLWELWGAHTGDPIMSSRNHLMFASYASALLALAVGVAPAGPGFAWGATVAPQGLGAANATGAALPFAGGSMATPRGEVGVSWSTVPPPPGPPAAATCGEAAEASRPDEAYVLLGCGGGGATIAAVAFASFGTPAGACGGAPFAVDPGCDAANSSAIVAAACLHRPNCSVPVDNRVFGDPCEGVKKWLAINVTCAGGPPPPPPPPRFLGSLAVSLPPNLPAAVRVPALGAASPAGLRIAEGAATVWAAGAFQPGAADGVIGGRVVPAPVAAGGFAVELDVLSGDYAFVVYAA